MPPGAYAAADDRAWRRRAHAGMERKKQLGRRPIGAVDGKAPAELVGVGPDLAAMARHAGIVFGLPGLGPAGCDRFAAFRLDELDAAGIGKRLLSGIDDLHHVAVRSR